MSVNDIQGRALEQLSYENKTQRDRSGPDNELGQDAFLRLMITQLENQNPLEPQKNSEFVAQLAQFSSVEGLQNLNSTVSGLVSDFQSSRALQATSMVGRAVTVPAEQSYLAEGGAIFGSMDLPASTGALSMRVYNEAGQLVWQRELGAQEAGELTFAWDGQLDDGSVAPPGEYRFEALAQIHGQPERLQTYLAANVNSVTLGPNNTMTLNLAGIGPVALGDVKEIL